MKKKKVPLAQEFIKFLEKRKALEEFKTGFKNFHCKVLREHNFAFNEYIKKGCTSYANAQGLITGAFPWHKVPTKNWLTLHNEWVNHTANRLKREIKKVSKKKGAMS